MNKIITILVSIALLSSCWVNNDLEKEEKKVEVNVNQNNLNWTDDIINLTSDEEKIINDLFK